MKQLITFTLFSLSCFFLQAQSIKLPAGKKFKVAMETKTTTTMSVMGQDLEMQNDGVAVTDFEVKNVSASGYTLSSTPRHIKVMVNAAGQSQTLDSDDETTRNSPQFSSVFGMLNKPTDIRIENNVLVLTDEMKNSLSNAGATGMNMDHPKFILTKDFSSLAIGSKWTDSSVTNEMKNYNEYTITKITGDVVELQVSTRSKIDATLKQNGMELKENLEGKISAVRIYEKISGLLRSELSDMIMTGTMEMMGQSAPMTMRGKFSTTVTQ